MGRIVEYVKFLGKVSILEFFYLNYFCKKIIRTDKSKIIPYKNTVVDLEPHTKIYIVGGDIELGCDLIRKSKTETRVRLRENAIWSSTGGCKISYGTTIELLNGAILENGYFTMNSNSTMVAAYRVSLGNDVMVSRNVVIYDSDFHTIEDENGTCVNKSKKVTIGDHVWIGANVTVLKGACVGAGSIIGANTTVSGNIPENCIVRSIFEKVCKENRGTWNRKKPEEQK